MLQDSDVITRGSNEDLGPEWDNVHQRLFLDYCSDGSLEALIHKRIIEQKYFTEKSLWLILNCLVDGLLAIEYGYEFQTNPQNGQSYHPGRRLGWVPIVRFDIKPDNVLLADDSLHYVTPIWKFADFGLAAYDFLDDPFSDEEREDFRQHGTEDYFTPEQFTEQWDFSDYKESEVAGQYSFYTNIWGVAVIIYQLATLSEDPPNHREPFLPDWNIALSQSPTYGLDIRAYNYSQTFTDLLFECLSEKSGYRPDLLELKNRVIEGYSAAYAADPSFEPYADFEQPEPVSVAPPSSADLPSRLSQLPPLPPSPQAIQI